jgi:hypothetical protein
MDRMKRIVFSCIGLTALVGCSNVTHTGADLSSFNPGSEIVKGETTEQQLVSQLGEPERSQSRSDSGESVEWIDCRTKPSGDSSGATTAKVSRLDVEFQDGVVSDYNESKPGE